MLLEGKGFQITLEGSSSTSMGNSLSCNSEFTMLVFVLLKKESLAIENKFFKLI